MCISSEPLKEQQGNHCSSENKIGQPATKIFYTKEKDRELCGLLQIVQRSTTVAGPVPVAVQFAYGCTDTPGNVAVAVVAQQVDDVRQLAENLLSPSLVSKLLRWEEL